MQFFIRKFRFFVAEQNMLFSQFSHLRRLVFYKSSPVQPVSYFRGGNTSVVEDGGRRTEILVSNFGCLPLFCLDYYFWPKLDYAPPSPTYTCIQLQTFPP